MSEPREHRFGREANHPLEALVMVPDPGVITGFGIRANPGNVTHAMAWYGSLERNIRTSVAPFMLDGNSNPFGFVTAR